MVTFVCVSLVAADLPALPQDPTANVKITANEVQGKSWNLYNYFIVH